MLFKICLIVFLVVSTIILEQILAQNSELSRDVIFMSFY